MQVQIGVMGGAEASINLLQVMMKRLHITGSTLRARSIEEKAAIVSELSENVWPLISEGKVSPLIHDTFSLENASSAHVEMEASTHVGKVIGVELLCYVLTFRVSYGLVLCIDLSTCYVAMCHYKLQNKI